MRHPNREKNETIMVEGHRAVEALIDAPSFEVVEVFVESGRHPSILGRCGARGIPCHELGGEELREKADCQFHRGAFATARRPRAVMPDEVFLASASRLLVPVELADAGNLGTLLRSAAAFGINGVLVGANRGVDIYSRKCIRASATAIFRMPVFEVDSLEHTLERIGEHGFIVLGASHSPSSRPLEEVRCGRKTALVLGSEGEGLPSSIERQCAELVRVPMSEELDSLNVAVSGAIFMWEWFGREQT